ncbi:MAG: hypothetical protein RI935_450 [Candidatus Parcubacteria bacterium]|jgi:FkbM family methyltransferase
MKWRYFKTLREKLFVYKALKKGNIVPLLQYALYRARLSHFFKFTRKWYTMRVFYSPYAFWLWTHKEREKDEELFFEKFLKEGDVVVDCGAHLGTLTITASKIVGDRGHVYAYEAHPRTFSFLKKNIHDNECKNVTALHVAVTDTNQSVRFSDYYVNDMNSVEENGPLEVTGNTLASLLYDVEKIDLLKLDIEGSELPALIGACDVLERVKAVYYEIEKHAYERFGYHPQDVITFLESKGFISYVYDKDFVVSRIDASRIAKARYYNVIALKNISSTYFKID